jgi:hypothetical protein
MQQVNDILEVKYYETPPFNASGSNSFRPDADFYVTPIGSEECREDDYCVCLPVGVECEDPSAIRLIIGIHTMAHFLLGPGSTDFSVPPEKIGSFGDIAASPNDPVFVLHHLMLDCILEEWMERHPGSGYPVHPDIRDGHRKDDYIRTYFPLITNGEVFESTQEFGYYCQLPDLDTTEPTPPCPLEPTFSFIISGSSVDVCVETKEAAAIKLILRDAGYKRYVKHMIGSSGCSTFNGLPAGVHRVKAITRKCVSGGGEGYISDVLYFSTK